jgi:beta-phosphoglucomutase-like phosphatase (HAD superfamily)
MITFDRNAYDGFIFDCDGTLADTMPLHYRAWTETLELKMGRPSPISPSSFSIVAAECPRARSSNAQPRFGCDLPVEQTAHEKEMRFVGTAARHRPVQEVVDVLNRLGPDAKVAVASGGLTEIVRETLLILISRRAGGEDQVSRRLRPGEARQAAGAKMG